MSITMHVLTATGMILQVGWDKLFSRWTFQSYLCCRPMEAAQAQLERAIIDSTLRQPTRAVPDGADMMIPDTSQAQPDRAVDETQTQPQKADSDDAQAQPDRASGDGAGPVDAQAQPQRAASDDAQAQQQAANLAGAQPQSTRATPGGEQVQHERVLPCHVPNAGLLQHSPEQRCNQRQRGEQHGAISRPKPASEHAQPRKR